MSYHRVTENTEVTKNSSFGLSPKTYLRFSFPLCALRDSVVNPSI